MRALPFEQRATPENFNEAGYLAANQDVADAVKSGHLTSGRSHFEQWGKDEARKLRLVTREILEAKKRKLHRIESLIQPGIDFTRSEYHYNFLSEDLREQFKIIPTDNVSSHPYEPGAVELIEQNQNGFVLDLGAGRRPEYLEHVVNYEIVPYDSTDVVGVGEVLPFKDDSFDAVISVAVLEHVKDPFRVAGEICRVLKPGGRLFVTVPFNFPLHGYPHHYYNMTHQGLRNLFDHTLDIEKQWVPGSSLPIWNLTWYLRSWSLGLDGAAKERFLNMKVSELIGDPSGYMTEPFVRQLSEEKNLELAANTALFARKPLC